MSWLIDRWLRRRSADPTADSSGLADFASVAGDRSDAGEDLFVTARHAMVETQLRRRDIVDEQVLAAMRVIPRHFFVPPALQGRAYEDTALAIGEGQTISQPYIVALMSQMLGLSRSDHVLEVGAGCGYQSAVLSKLVRRVDSVEILPKLVERARGNLEGIADGNVCVHQGDGHQGWLPEAPYDAIIVTCAARQIPPSLVQQLADQGRLAIPVGPPDRAQSLQLWRKEGNQLSRHASIAVRFVPMTGGEA